MSRPYRIPETILNHLVELMPAPSEELEVVVDGSFIHITEIITSDEDCCDLQLVIREKYLQLIHISIPDTEKGKGHGTKIIKYLINWCFSNKLYFYVSRAYETTQHICKRLFESCSVPLYICFEKVAEHEQDILFSLLDTSNISKCLGPPIELDMF